MIACDPWRLCLCVALILAFATASAWGQAAGSIRGVVSDADFEAPVPEATVTIAETGEEVTTGDGGNYVFPEVEPGTYTLVFSKSGYTRRVRGDVVVQAGQLTDVDASLSGDFAELEEFIVQDLQLEAGTEAALLQLRLDSPALLDSIGSELLSRAGAGDAAAGLRLVSGATVRDDKAVVRGLPDRYVSSQLNRVRLPSADAETRSIELDQFPSDVIESIQVSKTFTPDQQGDASGGAVNIVTKQVPDQFIFEMGAGHEINTQVVEAGDDFLTYTDGGLNFDGTNERREGFRNNPGDTGGIGLGTARGDRPVEDSLDLTLGGSVEIADGVSYGGVMSVFHERDASFHDNGIDDDLTAGSIDITSTNNPLQPTTSVRPGVSITQVFDVTEASEEVQWGGLFSTGIEHEDHSIGVTFFHTRTVTDTATFAEDTRGKQFFFPTHDPNNPPVDVFDPSSPDVVNDAGFGSNSNEQPYNRAETLSYTERITRSIQFNGDHTLPTPELPIGERFTLLPPEIDWTVALSFAEEDEPDRRQFGEYWIPEQPDEFDDNFPFGDTPDSPGPEDTVDPGDPATHFPLQPDNSFALGNFQRIFERIKEDSDQYAINLELPFEQWTGDRGYVKLGLFKDEVTRTFDQETFTNDIGTFGTGPVTVEGGFDETLSDLIEQGEGALLPIINSTQDIDYRGSYDIDAYYWMVDLPLTSWVKVIGGYRYETTDIEIIADPEEDAVVVDPITGGPAAAVVGGNRTIDPVTGLPRGDARFEQRDVLPSIMLVFEPIEEITFRAAYTETIARQTFRELSPVAQQEFLGGDIFIGNPNLKSAAVRNYDLRLDYRPYQGGLMSISWFRKNLSNPIEFVQRSATNIGTFDTVLNFPEGEIRGLELEFRQDMGYFFDELNGLAFGVNATFLDSEVTLPDSEVALLAGTGVDITKRQASNAPERLINFNLTYDNQQSGTSVGLFYTITGDTLVVGPGVNDGFVPSVFATEYGTLNFTLAQKLGEYFTLKFSAKNLTNPEIQTVYRSDFTPDTVKTSFTEGIDLSVSLTGRITF